MQWSDDAIVLSARKHGESAAIVNLLTREHGRHAGLVRGGAGRRARGVLQPGNQVAASWRARLAEHLGTLVCELERARAAALMEDAPRLAGDALGVCARRGRPARARAPPRRVRQHARSVGRHGRAPGWRLDYVRWELALLADLGYGLDLSACAATGATEDLTYVSPRTGRAVSDAAAQPYRNRLLRLPRFLLDNTLADADAADVAAGLTLTGFFLERQLLAPHGAVLPPARARFVATLDRRTTIIWYNRGAVSEVAESRPTPVPLTEALEERYLAYALSTITARSVPDVRDGLKPVQRRLVYAMRQLGSIPGRASRSARASSATSSASTIRTATRRCTRRWFGSPRASRCATA